MSTPSPQPLLLRTERPAHGGHVVARHAGRVVFVRDAAPDELVEVELTEAEPGARFWRGRAVRVVEASPNRVPHVWPQAGPDGVGGAELGHLTLAAQREWKAEVLASTMRRIAHIEVSPSVQALPGDDERGGLGTRTRVELVADAEGRAAMHRHRSHELVPLDSLPLAVPTIAASGVLTRRWRPGERLQIVAPGGGEAVILRDGEPETKRRTVTERVTATVPDGAGGSVERTWSYRLAASGFWQVHVAAPALLVARVLEAAALSAGESVLELYSGAGLLTLPLADAVGPTGSVTAVEGDADAVRFARRNAHDRGWVRLVGSEVGEALATRRGRAPRRGRGVERGSAREPGPMLATSPGAYDVVVLDPPRAGAGTRIMDALVRLAPGRIVYVACDPAALARDVARAAAGGYRLASLEGYDLFPHTHHVEAIAVLEAGAR